MQLNFVSARSQLFNCFVQHSGELVINLSRFLESNKKLELIRILESLSLAVTKKKKKI